MCFTKWGEPVQQLDVAASSSGSSSGGSSSGSSAVTGGRKIGQQAATPHWRTSYCRVLPPGTTPAHQRDARTRHWRHAAEQTKPVSTTAAGSLKQHTRRQQLHQQHAARCVLATAIPRLGSLQPCAASLAIRSQHCLAAKAERRRHREGAPPAHRHARNAGLHGRAVDSVDS